MYFVEIKNYNGTLLAIHTVRGAILVLFLSTLKFTSS